MNSTPKCERSKQVSNKVCINKSCTHSAFICKDCKDNNCERLHHHDNQLQVLLWSQIVLLTQKINVPANRDQYLLENMNKLKKQMKILTEDVNSTINLYQKRIKQCDKVTKMDSQFQNVWNKVKQERWNLLTGKQIRMMHDKLKSDNFIINKEEIILVRNQETENVEQLIRSINDKLNEYMKNDIIIIPQNWSQEDQERLKKYNGLIRQNPKQKTYYFKRAYLYSIRKQIDKALSDYNKAIECDPKYSDAYNNRGLIYYNKKQRELALSDYNKAIQYNPKYSDAYNNRGLIYFDRKQLEKALSDYNKAIQYNPKYSVAYNNRALIFQHRNSMEKAQSDYNKAIECDPTYSNPYNNRGSIYNKRNQLEKFLADFTKAIQYTKRPLHYRNRAAVYRKMNKIQQAEIDQATALQLSSK